MWRGNNITQLTQSLLTFAPRPEAQARRWGIAFRSMFSGANPVGIGCVCCNQRRSRCTSMWARKNKKDTDDLANSTKVLATEQSVLSGAFAGNDYKKAVQNISDLRINIDLAREGLISKRE